MKYVRSRSSLNPLTYHTDIFVCFVYPGWCMYSLTAESEKCAVRHILRVLVARDDRYLAAANVD